MAEFTGERVTPGEVDADLWSEHLARYAFAARLARRKRVLDAGCGTGYGAAELARTASGVVALDISQEALAYARAHYPLPKLHFLRASCAAMPLPDSSFDLVVAFEVIEHLRVWRDFLSEIRRILAPGGQCIISTPNKRYYGESRGRTGPNPYHEHEFEFDELREELGKVFPHVSMFLQNHVEGFVFAPVRTFSPAEARVESGEGNPEDSHFFVAVCALSPQTGAPTFVYLPRVANILRERELHIERLTEELATKGQWLVQLSEDHRKLLDLFRQEKDKLEESNKWAEQLNLQLQEAGATIRRLDAEMETMARGYEEKIVGLEEDLEKKTEWALETERRLEDKCNELAHCVELLHQAEKTVEERTKWALDLRVEIRNLEVELSRFKASRWVKLGRALRVGPEARNS